MIPVFKKGDLSQPGNYRPISLTSTVCKVFESIIRNNIIRHMSSNALFAKEQHGFLPRKSCITQLLTATEYWSEVLQHGDSVDVVYFDFRKAFDSVPHQRLLLKLKSYGIVRVVYWIGSLPSLQIENRELLLMNLTLAGLMSLVAFPRDQC